MAAPRQRGHATGSPCPARVPAGPFHMTRPRVVLLDAFGTLIHMEPPAPVLARLLAEAGHPAPEDHVARALATEIHHYRSRMHIARDAVGLAALRAECGGVLATALGPGAPHPELATELLVRALHLRLHDDALPVLDALEHRGVMLGVVSNWDCALSAHLARLGVLDRFDVVSVSAVVGAAKPDPAIFLHAVSALGVAPHEALHCGDHATEDCAGAQSAGVAAVLLDRAGRRAASPCPVIRTLAELPAIVDGEGSAPGE